MYTEFLMGNVMGRDLCIDRWLLLKYISKKKVGRVSAGFFWPRIGRSDMLM
jgi:hypothetical protein